MAINMIAAIGKNNEIGKYNNLIWHFHKDMKHFKKMTMGNYVVMGRNTFESLPNSLPGRTMIVISHQDLESRSDVICFHNPKDILDKFSEENIFIIGGQSMYEYFLPHADTMYLTEIDDFDYDADAYFPYFDKSEWKTNSIQKGEEYGTKYEIKRYIRKKENEKR